jgi:hypothetical protein
VVAFFACLSTYGRVLHAASAERDIPSGATIAVERGAGAGDCPDAPALDARIAKLRGHDDTRRTTVYVVGFKRTACACCAIEGRAAQRWAKRSL